jgi:hypothetical protein
MSEYFQSIITGFLLQLLPYLHAIYPVLYFWSHIIVSGFTFGIYLIIRQYPPDRKPYTQVPASTQPKRMDDAGSEIWSNGYPIDT